MKLRVSELLLLIGFIFENEAGRINLNDDYQLKFERMELVRFNESMVKHISVKTFKFNRTNAVVNATIMTKVDVGSEVEAIIQAYKFMSNEYRHFPLRFSGNVCLAGIANVAGIATAALKCGNIRECKLQKNKEYNVCYMQPDQSKLPPYVPDGQYMLQVQFLRYSTEMAVINFYGTVFRPIPYPD